jgi:vesicle-fusing ATPase
MEQKVSMSDFMRAVDEVKPAFGVASKQLENSVRGGFHLYGPQMQELYTTCQDFVKSVKNS